MLQPADHEEDLVTFDEFCRIVQDGQKADLLDGVIHMASPDTLDANDLNMFLVSLLRMFISTRKLGGKVLASRYACHIDDLNAPEPDILYVTAARKHLIERLGLQGSPDVAVEIVSRGSRTRDLRQKRELYERAGVLEYWIIDPRDRVATFLRLQDGEFQEVGLTDDGVFRSDVIQGFWLKTHWLFQNPIPDEADTLQTILGSNI